MLVSIVLLIKISKDLIADGYVWSWTLDGIVFYLDKIHPFLWIFAIPMTVLPIFLTIYTIRDNTSAKEASALLDIRNTLNQTDNITVHENLRGSTGAWRSSIPNDNETWRKIDNYLGTLELCSILLRKGTISFQNFEHQFGYRIDNIVTQPEIVNKIESERDSWEDLMYLIELDKNWLNAYNQTKGSYGRT